MNSQQKSIKRYFPNAKQKNQPPQKKFLAERIHQEAEKIQKKDSNECDNVKKCVNCEKCSEKEREINELQEKLKISEKKNSELFKDNKQLKHMLTQSNRVNLNKDIKIEQLQKQIAKEPEIISVKFNDKLTFSRFANIFNEQELASFRSIPASSSRDSSFILLALRTLYKDDLSILYSRTTSNALQDKQPITPQKKQIIQEIFYERLETLKLDIIECNLRKSKLNEHTATGINNARKLLNRHSL